MDPAEEYEGIEDWPIKENITENPEYDGAGTNGGTDPKEALYTNAAFTEMEALEAGRGSLAGRFWHVVDVQGPPGTLVSLATASSTSVRVEFAPEGDLEPSP